MWGRLIQNSFQLNQNNYLEYPDLAFIDAWSHTIQTYETTFSGVTLILIPDDGKDMPELATLPSGDQTALWNTKVGVLSAFIAAPGSNEKATMAGGMDCSTDASTDNSVSCEACTEDLTPEEAAYNALGDFFFGTIAAGHYGEQPPAPPYASPMHFLDMDYRDIGYAASHPCPCTCSKVIACASMQDLITLASHDLSATARKSQLGPPLSPSCTKPLVPCPPNQQRWRARLATQL